MNAEPTIVTRMPSRRNALGCLMGGGVFACWDPIAVYGQRRDVDDLFTAKIDAAIDDGCRYLASRFRDGAFLTPRWGENIGVCSLAALALLSRGYRLGQGEYGRMIEAIARRVISLANAAGFFFQAASTSHGPMYEHSFATLMLTEIYGTGAEGRIESALAAAISALGRSQSPRGGWRYDPIPDTEDLSVTVAVIMALRSAKNCGFFVSDATIDAAVRYLRSLQNPDGGFGYRLGETDSRAPLTAAAIVAFYNCGLFDAPQLPAAFDYLQTAGDDEVGAVANYFFYLHYYSTQAFWHLGGVAFEQWYSRVAALMLRLQSPDGSWTTLGQGSEFATAMAILALQTPRSVLPIYQR